VGSVVVDNMVVVVEGSMIKLQLFCIFISLVSFVCLAERLEEEEKRGKKKKRCYPNSMNYEY